MLPGIASLVEDVVFNYDPAQVKDFMWRTTLAQGAVAVKHLPTVTETGLLLKGLGFRVEGVKDFEFRYPGKEARFIHSMYFRQVMAMTLSSWFSGSETLNLKPPIRNPKP